MFSGNNTSSAAEITTFNMERFIAPVVDQYRDHLKAIGGHHEGVEICSLNLSVRSEKIRQPHYLMNACDEGLQEHLIAFFRDNNVMPILMATGHHIHTIAVLRKDILDAGLTSKHEGEFFYQLNVDLKAQQAKLAEENSTTYSLRP